MQYWDNQTIDKIRRGYYSAVYFNRTKHILEQEKNYKKVTMQIFQKSSDSILCGADEVLELLKTGTGYFEGGNAPLSPLTVRGGRKGGVIGDKWISKFDELEVKSLSDGDKLVSGETVMHIAAGPYVYFAHLESLYLGILARRTLVATNVRRAVKAAAGKQIIFFADRFDYFLNQEGDGYAAHIGGASAICTEAMGNWWGASPVGTIPHALMAVNNGDTLASARQFMKHYPDVNLIALVDFENDCVRTSLELARALKGKLWGVRLDTAENIVDKSLTRSFSRSYLVKGLDDGLFRGATSLRGVNPKLVKLVRNALDKEGFKSVKIVVSGGFDEDKIKRFEKEKTPVDAYGVGSSLLKGNNDFTADVVKVDGKKVSKVGRKYAPNSRLQLFKLV